METKMEIINNFFEQYKKVINVMDLGASFNVASNAAYIKNMLLWQKALTPCDNSIDENIRQCDEVIQHCNDAISKYPTKVLQDKIMSEIRKIIIRSL